MHEFPPSADTQVTPQTGGRSASQNVALGARLRDNPDAMSSATTDKKVLRLNTALLPVIHQPDGSVSGTYEIWAIWSHPRITGLLGVISRFTLPQQDSIAHAPCWQTKYDR
jgi:hypothetical protein